MMQQLLKVVTGLFLSFSILSTQAQPDPLMSDHWKIIGPGGGGGVFQPTISPFNSDLVLSYCDMTAAYISSSGGEDWRMINFGTVPVDFAFDPVDANTIYVATRGYRYSEERGSGLSMLFRSEDRGKTWSVVYSDVVAFDATIQKIAIDPADHNKLYLGLSPLRSYMSDQSAGSIKKSLVVSSSDYGRSWKLLSDVPGEKINGLFIHKGGKLSVYTETHANRIDLITGNAEAISFPVKKITSAKLSGNTIFLQSDFSNDNGKIRGGIFVSTDFGAHWTQRNKGLVNLVEDDRVPDIRRGFAVSPVDMKTAYIAVNRYRRTDNNKPERMYCIYKTNDAGSTWLPVLLSSSRQGYITKNFSGSWMEKSYDPGWGESPIDLAVAAKNPNICFASDEGRAYKTTDGGKSWKQVYSKTFSDSTFASNGLDVTTCYGIHFDPFDKNHFFICYTDIGLFHTFDGGKSWRHSAKNIPAHWLNTCYEVAFDPKVKGRVWSVWANAHDLPREKMFGNGFDHFAGGVAVSDDGGLTWNLRGTGIPDNSVCTSILIDTNSSVESRALYVSVFGRGIYKSTDGGMNWKLRSEGLGANRYAWELRDGASGRIWLLCSKGFDKKTVVDGVLYYSDDKGENWLQQKLPDSVNGPHDLLIDPADSKTLYLSCWPRQVMGVDKYGGVLKSTDNGITWKQVFNESFRVNSAAADKYSPGKIYINTFQRSAYKSNDDGESWEQLPGYDFKWGQRVIPDIHHPGMLYLTTYGGSVFYGSEK